MESLGYVITYIIGTLFGFVIGAFVFANDKNVYNDACRMSDCIRYTLANDSNKTIKEGCKLFLWDKTIEDRIVPLNNYSYCY